MDFQDWHVHTAVSPCSSEPDWRGKAVVDRALEAGLATVGITDHLFPGLEIEQVLSGAREVRAAAQGTGLSVCMSLEVETLDETGRMRVSDGELAGLDYVLAAAGHLHLDWVRKPARTVRAVVDYHHQLHLALCGRAVVDVVAHPWCGLHPSIAETMGIKEVTADDVPEAQVAELCQAAAESGTALEINCSHNRLEIFRQLHQRLIAAGAKYGTLFSLGSDAHDSEALNRVGKHWGQLAEWGLTEKMLWEPVGK